MELNFDEKLAVVQVAQNVGYNTIIKLLRMKTEGIKAILSVPQPSVEEDLRALQLWRGYNDACFFLESLPRLVAAELEAQSKGPDPTQGSLFGVADANEVPDLLKEAHRPEFGPKPPPSPHPLMFR